LTILDRSVYNQIDQSSQSPVTDPEPAVGPRPPQPDRADRPPGGNGAGRVEIADIRRREVVEAAVAIIAEQGLQNLSLSEIEARAGMSRGQLTYYFKTKEAILLAVFDHLQERLWREVVAHFGATGVDDLPGFAVMIDHFLRTTIQGPPRSPEFSALLYTFLAQMPHREDFRGRLATLFEQWRRAMAADLAADRAARPGAELAASPRTVAALIQSLFHGLAMQRAADPAAFDGPELLDLCRRVIAFVRGEPSP
jgi:AcrR family transcriptional regulator